MPADTALVLPAQRRRRLLDLLDGRGPVRVTELAAALRVSTSTVRRDLAGLHAQGRVVRVHGGAGSPADALVAEAGPAAARVHEKRAIGRAAAKLVEDGMTVMLLSGTTTAAMVPFLTGRRDVTLATNGLDIAHAAAHACEDIAVVVLGGVLHRAQMTMVGSIAEHNLQALHVDRMFGGVWGVDASVGATGPKLIQGGRRDLLRHTDSLIVVADATKLGRRGPARLADPDQIERVITDRTASPAVVEGMRAAGMRVDVCR